MAYDLIFEKTDSRGFYERKTCGSFGYKKKNEAYVAVDYTTEEPYNEYDKLVFKIGTSSFTLHGIIYDKDQFGNITGEQTPVEMDAFDLDDLDWYETA